MKRKSKNSYTPRVTPQMEKLGNLIDRVLETYSEADITQAFIERITGWKERENIVKVLLADENFYDDIKAEVSDVILAGRIVLEIKEMDKATKLNEFLCKEIFPFYADQQAQNLLFN